ncbi:amidohydrolase family protein [Actinospica sp.]|uniref:amidohydrolase family protein n=1 Tax=Actinospica sp. TaxID=1872142 RepID=UPI002CD83EA2|nr:amidohydrolase family protein [Actinospica sp.]HWG26346.1 amidohydrolase family protein [Actinospica sp.]
MTAVSGRIDAHHHFWDPARYTYPWMAGAAMDPVRRAFTPADLTVELGPADVAGTVLVQTVSDLSETREFLDIAARTDFVKGVVGWVDLTAPSVADDLDELLDGPTGSRLVGIRHQVHDEPDARWLCRDDVRRGLAAVQSRRLAYDLLVRARELPAATETVAAFPELRFVLDHIAKPRIVDGHDELWSERMPRLAALPNVRVKLSGMVTEADWMQWTSADLRPFVASVVEWFGTDRVMFGSDWPVCLLAGSYHSVSAALADALGPLSSSEERLVYRDNALTAYRLDTT